jgi:hypothetical protein
MKTPSVAIGLTALLVLILFTVSSFGLVTYFLAITLLGFLVLFLANSNLINIAFLVFLPTNDIFHKEDFLFSFLGLKQILSSFVILFFLKNWKYIKPRYSAIRSSKKYKHLLGALDTILIILILYFNYTYFKNAFFGIHGYSIESAVLKSINMTLQLTACWCVLRTALCKMQLQQVNSVMISSITLMIIFSSFSPLLPRLGFRSLGTEKSEFEQVGFERFSGIVADGDSNTLSVYLTLAVGICLLFYIYYQKKIYILYPVPLIILIGIAGSRTGIIALVVMLLVFFALVKNQHSSRTKIQLLLFLPFIVVVSIPFFELIINRFELINEQFDINSTSNRIGKWALYVTFLWQHKTYLLTGARSELLISWDSQYYSAHNAFITITYNSGLVFSLAFLTSIGLFIWFSYKNKMYEHLMISIPSFILMNTVSDLGIIYSMLLFSIILIRNRFFFEYRNFRAKMGNPEKMKNALVTSP